MQHTLSEEQWLTYLEHGWVEESYFKKLQKASVFSDMAGECTDIMAVEEL